MKLPRWLRRDGADSAAPEPQPQPQQTGPSEPDIDPTAYVRWVPAGENPFGVDVLDCAVFARSMVAMTSDPDIAKRFGELRGSQGDHCRDVALSGPGQACRLEYPYDSHAEGPVFLAQQMEDKWDVFLVGGRLCFCRSWTGMVAHQAIVTFEASRAIVTSVHSHPDRNRHENPVAIVDFLVKSHIFGLVAPHPLAGAPNNNEGDLAYWSFAAYGRRGVFGTREDVTSLQVRKDEQGRSTLMRGVTRTTD